MQAVMIGEQICQCCDMKRNVEVIKTPLARDVPASCCRFKVPYRVRSTAGFGLLPNDAAPVGRRQLGQEATAFPHGRGRSRRRRGPSNLEPKIAAVKRIPQSFVLEFQNGLWWMTGEDAFGLKFIE